MNTDAERGRDPRRGREARWPSHIPARGWQDVLWRVWGEISEDQVMLVAAGVTFYLLLALFPALAAFVSLYGFVADPATIAGQISFLEDVLPSGGFDLIRSQLEELAAQERNVASFGFVVAFLIALWSANTGVKTLFQALNIAYEESESRSFLVLNALSLAFTLGLMVVGILLIAAVGVVPAVLSFLQLGGVADDLVRIGRWPVTLIVIALAIMIFYRYGPDRERVEWRWVTWGAAVATLVWLAASVAFSFYLQNFANYNATYGSLGAVIGFMMWVWISTVILLVGAELNAEMEHQTTRDSTVGGEKPMGERGAAMADTLGEATGDENGSKGR